MPAQPAKDPGPIETVETTEDITGELTLESVSSWTDYADIALKAVIAVAAVVIALRLHP